MRATHASTACLGRLHRFHSNSSTLPAPAVARCCRQVLRSTSSTVSNVTCIDNGMPVVILRARDLGKTGEESPAALEADRELKERVERIRLALGERMHLGDVARKTVPKMTLVAPPRRGGTIGTRTFIPHRVHEAIGVLGAVSVATACMLPGSVAAQVAGVASGGGTRQLEVEHPTGFFTVEADISLDQGNLNVKRVALLRTARRLMRGEVFVPGALWSGR